MSGEPRLTAALLVGAMIRRAQALGGHGTVLAKGDETAGAIIVVLAERGRTLRFVERGMGPSGEYAWMPCGPESDDDSAPGDDYLARRRRFDPDLWIIEIDLADGERLLADLTGVA